jgi:hypothetical protein
MQRRWRDDSKVTGELASPLGPQPQTEALLTIQPSHSFAANSNTLPFEHYKDAPIAEPRTGLCDGANLLA